MWRLWIVLLLWLLCGGCTTQPAPEKQQKSEEPEPVLHERFEIPADPPEAGIYHADSSYSIAVLGLLRDNVLSEKLQVSYDEVGIMKQSIDCHPATPRRHEKKTSITAQCLYRHSGLSVEQAIRPKEVELFIDIERLDEYHVSLHISKVFMTHGMPLVDAIAIQREMHKRN